MLFLQEGKQDFTCVADIMRDLHELAASQRQCPSAGPTLPTVTQTPRRDYGRQQDETAASLLDEEEPPALDEEISEREGASADTEQTEGEGLSSMLSKT